MVIVMMVGSVAFDGEISRAGILPVDAFEDWSER
jgi:hypothetical protein